MNVVSRRAVSRRTILRGLGAAVGLPWMECMTETRCRADATGDRPTRMAFLYVGNGVRIEDWDGVDPGPLPEKLPAILQPLEGLRRDVSVIGGLSNRASLNGDIAAHTRAQAAFLTGVCPTSGPRSGIRLGVSVDQAAAKSIGDGTRIPSLSMAVSPGSGEAGCYDHAYHNLSWQNATTPVRSMTQPRDVFELLFCAAGRHADGRRSVLDYVKAEAASLRPRLSSGDARKLDEYFDSIRDIEQRIARAGQWTKPTKPADAARPEILQPFTNWTETVRIFRDLMVLAFQTDSTRICTWVLLPEHDSKWKLTEIGLTQGIHDLSHTKRPAEGEDEYSKANRYHMSEFATLLGKLKAEKEGEHSLLDTCMIAYGSSLKNGYEHSVDDLPIILAGRGGGLNPGRFIRFDSQPPLSDLWLSMLGRIGSPLDRIGDSTGRLEGL